jgi:hypothetical protein
MKLHALWLGLSIGLLVCSGVRGQTTRPATAIAPAFIETGTCQPACGVNQICASSGQCLQLVRLVEEPLEPPEPEKVHRSKPLMVTGIVIVSAGGIIAGIGILELMFAGLMCMFTEDHGVGERCGDEKPIAKKGGLALLAGAGVLGIGTPIVVYGAFPVVKRPRLGRAGPSVELLAGPASLSLRGSF